MSKPGRITFSKAPFERFARFAPVKYRAKRAGVVIANIQEHRNGGWFWYAAGVNTSGKPKDREACIAEIKAHFSAK